ncbi:MAG: cyclic nucleotide-binding domain-containing protein, partial [Deltaproteobacteria bacterium]|nr:cyclic nucleotide-binding domain-containing protein [Deltaproteobacteria bacterium]
GRPDDAAPVPPEAWVPVAWTDAQVCDAAAALAASREGLPAWPGVVPAVPLLSELPPEAFANILGTVKRRALATGEAAVREGDPGDSFFLLARGRVAVTRRGAALATLEEGAVFGEMALLSAAPRAATVTATEPSDALVFGRDALNAAARELPVIAAALERFMRQRLVQRLLDTHPMFEPFDAGQRLQLASRFEPRAVAAGQVLLREGEPGSGLHVVLHGAVTVTRATPTGPAQLADLGPGDVFGEISLLEAVPVTATVTATTGAMVLVLPSAVFLRLVEGVPGWRRYFEELADDRRMDQRLSLPPTPAASGWY